MPESILQAIFLLGVGVGVLTGLGIAALGLLFVLNVTEAEDQGPTEAVENARLFGYGILSRAQDGTLEALSPSVWTIRRRAGRQ